MIKKCFITENKTYRIFIEILHIEIFIVIIKYILR